jgi:hypothetical protein
MNNEEIAEMKIKILKGIDVAYQKLLDTKIKEDGAIAVSKNGKVILVKAKDLTDRK